jgi:O-antigen/teichoic acid export membrane protein
MSAPARTLTPGPSTLPSQGEGRTTDPDTGDLLEGGVPEASRGKALSSPGEGGGEGTGEEGRGGEGREGGLFRSRLVAWTRILSAYFTTQTLTQLAGIAAGLLFVNFMPVREFALYTLAFSVITFFTFVSDLGSTTSLVYFFHRSKGEAGEMRRYVAAVLSLRRIAFVLGAAGIVAVFPRAALAKGFGWRESLLALAGLLLAVWFQVSASVRVLALRLADRYGQSYRAEMSGGGVRLALAALLVAAGALRAWLGVLSAALGSVAVSLLARPERGETAAVADLRPYRRQVLRYLLPSLPSALYFSIQGPLTIWLATTFGSTRNMAEVGALGRLGLVVGIFSNLTGVVFLPRLARIADERLYLRRYLQFGALLLAVAAALTAAAAAGPSLFLLLLGGHYAGLHRELFLVVAGSGLTLLGGYAVAVNLARSWNRWEGLAVVVLIAVQAGLVAVLPLGTTAGVLLFNVCTGATGLLLQLIIALGGFVRPGWVRWMT